MIKDEVILRQVQFLASCYPQLNWDGVMTAGAWSVMLNEINATEEELVDTCKYIVRNGYESWRINIALIIDMIKNNREIDKEIKRSKEYLNKINDPSIQVASLENVEKAIKKIKRIIGGSNEKI